MNLEPDKILCKQEDVEILRRILNPTPEEREIDRRYERYLRNNPHLLTWKELVFNPCNILFMYDFNPEYYRRLKGLKKVFYYLRYILIENIKDVIKNIKNYDYWMDSHKPWYIYAIYKLECLFKKK